MNCRRFHAGTQMRTNRHLICICCIRTHSQVDPHWANPQQEVGWIWIEAALNWNCVYYKCWQDQINNTYCSCDKAATTQSSTLRVSFSLDWWRIEGALEQRPDSECPWWIATNEHVYKYKRVMTQWFCDLLSCYVCMTKKLTWSTRHAEVGVSITVPCSADVTQCALGYALESKSRLMRLQASSSANSPL